ncbi:2289_t:CDS:2 [Dentiscutata erythropus]|uniref:2289_t:CDS:1 n=1 Tax=Dentiscutata erythropus TaxID=1348616 RepID=A0A9N8Z9K2_9GLOM|nr:2289_t:CDS:2 [Dentiscutata erythropus]
MSSKRVITIGIGGASCSGKTLEKDLPIDPITNYTDWDCPDAINFPLFLSNLKNIHQDGTLPTTFVSNEVNNIFKDIERDELNELVKRLSLRINEVLSASVGRDNKNVEWYFVLVDGFLLYYDPEVINELDVKFFVKADREIMKKRREERISYVTVEGYYEDPPEYFDKIVWPNYIKFHKHLSLKGQSFSLINGEKSELKVIEDMVAFDSNHDKIFGENLEKAVETVIKFIEKKW